MTNPVQNKVPTELEVLRTEIHAALDRDETNRTDWVSIKMTLTELIGKARKTFQDNVSFGKWFDKEIGNTVGKNDRAAFVEMSKNLFVAREVFEATTRTSVQHIFEKEFKKAAGIATGAKKGHNSKGANTSSSKEKAATPGAAPVRKPVFTQAEFKSLQKVLHSDRIGSITKAEMDKAFALLMAHETELVGSKAEQKAEKAKAKAKAAPAAQPQPEQAAA